MRSVGPGLREQAAVDNGLDDWDEFQPSRGDYGNDLEDDLEDIGGRDVLHDVVDVGLDHPGWGFARPRIGSYRAGGVNVVSVADGVDEFSPVVPDRCAC